ncbi:hypothetical protein BS78_05G124600 [Paspalum vaginatum]|nr:hypothetical protein BS78_05G124600 [Paspalum vaginatum]KAJ1275285.1 hypothetical protein BS78_05G124600 [Paspalum vaginatum]
MEDINLQGKSAFPNSASFSTHTTSRDQMATQASGAKSPEKNQNPENALPQLSFDFLSQVTNGFSEELKLSGQFATFYKGTMPDGRVITVKLARNGVIPANEQYVKEIKYLRQIQHENILKLLGFCSEADPEQLEHKGKNIEQKGKEILMDADNNYLLCYEYAPKSLREFLSDDANIVDWATNFKIIKGIIHGLHFLHEKMDGPIVHMDLQPANILLDANMMPKIANFSLSRRFGQEQTEMETDKVVGLKGYMAPEYLYSGEISPQCDIYSLGVLLLEIATRVKNRPNDEDMSARNFIASIRQTWTDEHIASQYSSLDPNDIQDVKACIDTGLKCVDVAQKNRPSIVEIVNRFSRKRGM